MPQVALVTDQHDDDVAVGVIPQLFQPSGDVFVGLVLAYVVDEQCTDGAAVVGGCDGPITLLAGRVPDLRLDGFGIDLDGPCCEFDADGGLGVEVELVAGEAREEVGFTNSRISYEDHCEWTCEHLLHFAGFRLLSADREAYP